MVIDRQNSVALSLPAIRAYVGKLRAALRLGGRHFNLCFVNDREMKRLNAAFRKKRRPTDVLSFPWKEEEVNAANGPRPAELRNFLGDVVISIETAWRNARAEGHTLRNEIRWLMLHGLLHLLGYDHETDAGEMTTLEHRLRDELGIANGLRVKRKSKDKK